MVSQSTQMYVDLCTLQHDEVSPTISHSLMITIGLAMWKIENRNFFWLFCFLEFFKDFKFIDVKLDELENIIGHPKDRERLNKTWGWIFFYEGRMMHIMEFKYYNKIHSFWSYNAFICFKFVTYDYLNLLVFWDLYCKSSFDLSFHIFHFKL